MEFLVIIALFGYIYYLRNYADLRSATEKEQDVLAEGILLFQNKKLNEAYLYFDQRIKSKPKSCIAYLYRGLCHKSLENEAAAMKDLQTAASLDDNVFKIQLELGKLYFENADHEMALLSFNKAINIDDYQRHEAYHWRAQTHLKLFHNEEAQADFESETHLLEQRTEDNLTLLKPRAPFVDRRLIASTIMVILTSGLIISVIKNAESVHLPYLVTVFSAISIGFAEPNKGWLLAIMQCVLIVTGYLLFTQSPENGGQKELENFGLYGSVILTFAASFLGGFLKKALNMK